MSPATGLALRGLARLARAVLPERKGNLVTRAVLYRCDIALGELHLAPAAERAVRLLVRATHGRDFPAA